MAPRNLESFRFSDIDYIVFILVILISTLFGFYMGFIKPWLKSRKEATQPDMDDFLSGKREMTPFPIALSLIGGYVSAVTIMGNPPEIYNYGTQYFFVLLAIALHGVVVSYVYMPIYLTLNVDSSYQYLEMRFSPAVRAIISYLFVMDEIFFLPIIVYVPAIAFEQVTGVDHMLTTAVTSIVTTLYTLFGGIKAVVHTDAWQVIIMFLAVISCVIVGTIHEQGFNVFNAASAGGRLIFFNMSLSPYERYSFWNVLFGNAFYWISFNGINQTMVRGYMSLPSVNQARVAILYFCVGMIFFVFLVLFAGLLLYSAYGHCDPLSAGMVSASDQMFALYIMDSMGSLKGLPGLFIAGIFGAALSSLSVVLHATAQVVLQDIIKGSFKMEVSEAQSIFIMKFVILIGGLISLFGVLIVSKLGSIFLVAYGLTTIAASISCGIFSLGMFFPWANSIGAIVGALAGFLFSLSAVIGRNVVAAQGLLVDKKLPLMADKCGGNVTIPSQEVPNSDGVFFLFRIAVQWLAVLTVLCVIIVGLLVSFITGHTKAETVSAKLISPVFHRWLPKECFDLPDPTVKAEKK